MNKEEIGLKRIQEILGPEAHKLIERFSSISEDFSKYIVELAYGDFYARDGLSDKTREVAAISTLISQGNTGLPLKAHIRGMLNVGHTQREVIELLLFLIPYIGFPHIVDAFMTAETVFNEM
ncbi:MAG: carboxymuconolactone decarboxylase family protein [Opitutales bacterium]